MTKSTAIIIFMIIMSTCILFAAISCALYIADKLNKSVVFEERIGYMPSSQFIVDKNTNTVYVSAYGR